MTVTGRPNSLGLRFLNGEPIEYTINAGTVITDTSRTTFGYRLIEVGVGAVTPDLSYAPRNGEVFRIAFDKDIKNVLTSTNIPSLYLPLGVVEDVTTGFIKKFALQWWTVTFETNEDELFCDYNLSEETTEDEFSVINSSLSYRYPVYGELGSGNQTELLPLTYYPKELVSNRGHVVLYYVLMPPQSSGYIKHRTLNTTFAEPGPANINMTNPSDDFKVMAVSIYWRYTPGDPLTTLNTYCFQLHQTAPITDAIHYFSIFPTEYANSLNLFFQTSLGGIATVSATFQELGYPKSSSTIKTNTFDAITPYKLGNVVDVNIESYRQYSIQIDARQVNVSYGYSPLKVDEWFYEDFINSGMYWIPENDLRRQVDSSNLHRVRVVDFKVDKDNHIITAALISSYPLNMPSNA